MTRALRAWALAGAAIGASACVTGQRLRVTADPGVSRAHVEYVRRDLMLRELPTELAPPDQIRVEHRTRRTGFIVAAVAGLMLAGAGATIWAVGHEQASSATESFTAGSIGVPMLVAGGALALSTGIAALAQAPPTEVRFIAWAEDGTRGESIVRLPLSSGPASPPTVHLERPTPRPRRPPKPDRGR